MISKLDLQTQIWLTPICLILVLCVFIGISFRGFYVAETGFNTLVSISEQQNIAYDLNQEMMTMRLSNFAFQATNNPDYATQLIRSGEMFEKQTTSLINQLDDVSLVERYKNTLELKNSYQKAFSQFTSSTKDDLKHYYRDRMNDIGPKMVKNFTAAQDQLTQKTVAIQQQELKQLNDKIKLMISLSAIGIALSLGISFIVIRGLSAILYGTSRAMHALSKGDKSVTLQHQERTDAIGDMARSLAVFHANLLEKERLEQEQAESKRRAEQEKRAAMMALADQFDSKVGIIIQTLSAAATELESTSSEMGAQTDQTSQRATSSAASAEQASQNIGAIAAAVEELSSAIRDVANQVHGSAKESSETSQRAEQARDQMTLLSEAIVAIDNVLGSINDVAEQTNLLALNATIEAARAGEAGKGFAVVATEVKNLAQQTHKLTELIRSNMVTLRQAKDHAVEAVDQIMSRISVIDLATTRMAAAVEEQSAATSEISRNIQQVSVGTQELNRNINHVQVIAKESAVAAQNVNGAASDVASQSNMLQHQVDTFLHQVRAA